MSLPPVVLVQNTAQDVLPDLTKKGPEIVIRELYNSGANAAYYRYGGTCDANNYNAILAAGQMLEVPVLQRVSMLCTGAGGTTISITQIQRDDLGKHANTTPS